MSSLLERNIKIRVPELEKENLELKEKIRELQEEVDTLNAATSDLSSQLMKGE